MLHTHASGDRLPCIELAGFAAAQAVCCLFDRQPMLPLAFTRRKGHAVTISIMSGCATSELAARVTEWLDSNVDDADAAVVVCDGYVTVAGTRKDALVLDCRSYAAPVTGNRITVPYRGHHHPGGFAVYRPKFIVEAGDGHDAESMTQAFFSGVFSHKNGGPIWQACADQSW